MHYTYGEVSFKDGYEVFNRVLSFRVTGRIDDMLNVSGHLLSTAEVESALLEHPAVAENATVAHPHPVKGECLYCFITLREVSAYNHCATSASNDGVVTDSQVVRAGISVT